MKNQNVIDEVLDSQGLSTKEKKAFWDIIRYAKMCQKAGNIEALKSHVEQTINNTVKL